MFLVNPAEATADFVANRCPMLRVTTMSPTPSSHSELALQAELFPKSSLRPFAYLGLGFMFYSPDVSAAPEVWNRRSEHMNDDARNSLAIPAGGGLKYTINDKFDIYGSVYKVYNFTDNLDGWTSEINDNITSFSLGMLYFLGDRYRKVEAVPVPQPVILDTDGDGLLDADEINVYKTDPKNRDTDGDGLIDGDEVTIHKTDPLKKDTDGDRLIDGDEVLKYKTDPLKKDTDGDGCIDGDEVLDMKTNPLRVDTDGDDLSDCDEVNKYRTNPLVPDTDGDSVNDGLEVKNGTDPLKADVLRVEEGKNIVLEGINFETNRSTILPESEEILIKAYNTLRTNPELRVEIGGHTDDVGRDAANQRLSEARANSVKTWLVNRGIATERMTTKGYGETTPRVPNTSPENRFQNRRIEFRILK
jgi:outer membrane protein OmpA-like peptidoglycan-associated protein